ncbi:hypothetical protein J15TS10_38040 [Paenibacillus woosongensis]|uniref:Uncharacterized protein n=1 Tax=Paenibacillus woosongensis TaxID=307580 RepID=A0ABQ4MVT5_9BACL|nr:hypothetical protein J15TS10_38040 [Paenibacillus woosongensis]
MEPTSENACIPKMSMHIGESVLDCAGEDRAGLNTKSSVAKA